MLALPTGAWQGPVESGYGWHLVRVESRSEARPADYEQARAEVRAAWLEQVRSEADDVLYERLREGYEVEIDAAMREIAGALQ